MKTPRCCKCGEYSALAHMQQVMDVLLYGEGAHMVDDALYPFQCLDEKACAERRLAREAAA